MNRQTNNHIQQTQQFQLTDIWIQSSMFWIFLLLEIKNKPEDQTFFTNQFQHPQLLENLVEVEKFYHNRIPEFFQYQLFLTSTRVCMFITPIFSQIHSYSHRNNQSDNFMQVFVNIATIFIQNHMDIMMEKQRRESKAKDLKVMKVIHDLKNPILSIKQIVNSVEIHIDNNNTNHNHNNKNSSHSEHTANYLMTRKGSKNINSMKSRNSIEAMHENSKRQSMNQVGLEQEQEKALHDIQNQVNMEVEDIEEMIENLKTEFKSKNQMKFREEIKEVASKEFLESFKNTHSKLTESGKNLLKLIITDGFPKNIEIPKSLIKRIMNNFVSNSLKHTSNGEVEIYFTLMSQTEIGDFHDWLQLGAELEESDQQLCFRIEDTGKGIPRDKLALIFTEKESDQSGENWDGCGLGLPICEILAHAIGARIFQFSVENSFTSFALIIKYNIQASNEFTDMSSSITKDINEHNLTNLSVKNTDQELNSKMNKNHSNMSIDNTNNNIPVIWNEEFQYKEPLIIEIDFRVDTFKVEEHLHQCNSILLAEDNSNILKRQTKQLDKKTIPQMCFLNGSDCLSQLIDDFEQNCSNCKKSIVITDMHMPFMDGQELAVELKKVDKLNRVHLVLLSADDPSEEFKKLNLFNEILVKPLTLSKLAKWNEWLVSQNGETHFINQDSEIILSINDAIVSTEIKNLEKNSRKLDIDINNNSKNVEIQASLNNSVEFKFKENVD